MATEKNRTYQQISSAVTPLTNKFYIPTPFYSIRHVSFFLLLPSPSLARTPLNSITTPFSLPRSLFQPFACLLCYFVFGIFGKLLARCCRCCFGCRYQWNVVVCVLVTNVFRSCSCIDGLLLLETFLIFIVFALVLLHILML